MATNYIPKSTKKAITDGYAANPYVCLLTGGYIWSSSHASYNDVKANEVAASGSGTPYVAGGQALACTSSNSGENAILTSNAGTSTWTSVTWAGANSPYWAVVYNATTGNIIAILGLDGPNAVTAGTFTLTWDGTNGIVKIS